MWWIWEEKKYLSGKKGENFCLFKSKRVWQKHVESDLQKLTSGAVLFFILYVFLHLVLTLYLSVVLISCPNVRIQSNIIPLKIDMIYHTTEISRGMRDSGERLQFCKILRNNLLEVREIARVTSAKSVLYIESCRGTYCLLKSLSCMDTQIKISNNRIASGNWQW